MTPEIQKADPDPEAEAFLAELKRKADVESIETERIIGDALWGIYGDES